MKKIKLLIFSIVLIFTYTITVSAKNVDVYLFHSNTCPHCAEEKEYLENIKDDVGINIHYYEVNENPKAIEQVRKKLNIDNSYVPLTVIGSDYLIGFGDNTKDEIKNIIDAYRNTNYCSAVKVISNDGNIEKCINQNKGIYTESEEKKIPLLGKVNIKEVSLPLISIVIGFVDGFNPCAMWVLLFLISMLIGMKDKKRMITIGFTFLFTSALVYLLFMIAWLNAATLLLTINWVRLIIGLIALVGAVINLSSYVKHRKDNGCDVIDDKKRSKIFDKIKRFTHEKNFALALIGAMALAVSVNIVELACSAGLPVMFIEILSMNHPTIIEKVIYIGLYMIFFLLDDLIVFIVAVSTMELTGFSTKYGKLSKLIGGLLLLGIGILLIFKPEWLMFNF
jgi:glutaredoxin